MLEQSKYRSKDLNSRYEVSCFQSKFMSLFKLHSSLFKTKGSRKAVCVTSLNLKSQFMLKMYQKHLMCFSQVETYMYLMFTK